MMAKLPKIRIETAVAIMLYNDVASMRQRSFPKLDAYSESIVHSTRHSSFSFNHNSLKQSQLSLATFDELSI